MTVFVNAIMYYKVANATHAVSNVDDYSGSARLLAATTLRNVLGTLTLGEILSQRESIAKDMRVRYCFSKLNNIIHIEVEIVMSISFVAKSGCSYRALGS